MGTISVNNVSKTFLGRLSSSMRVEALHGISLNIRNGEFIALIGPSGCGKSTLLNIVAGLVKATSGSVAVAGEEVLKPDPRKIAIIFQESSLFPWRTVVRNVTFGLEALGLPGSTRNEVAQKYIRMVGLEGFEHAYPAELSGGMRQRVSMARGLALETPVLLMDEPFGALDEQTRIIMGEELLNIWSATRKTVLFVTHSILEAATLADRIVVMTSRPGTVKSVFDADIPRPRDPNSEEVNRLRRGIWDQLKVESLKTLRMESRSSG